MKKLSIFLFIIGLMSLLNQNALAQIPFGSYLSTIGPADVYPTHLDNLGLGGYRSVATGAGGERDAITTERRKQGMLVYVVADDKTYMLKSAIPDITKNVDGVDWVLAGGGSGTAWSLGGNTIGAGTNTFGTIDDSPVIFNTFGVEAFRVTSNSNGTTPGNVNLKAGLLMNDKPILSDNLTNLLIGNTSPTNITGGNNVMIGDDAGKSNMNGANNFFIGTSAGSNNTSGNNNTFFGILSGGQNIDGNNNIGIGYSAGPVYPDLNNTIAIGYGATADQDNAMILGGTGSFAVQVGINTSAPRASLDIATTDAVIVPVGTTFERPSATTGSLRFNRDNDKLEYADKSNTWQNISNNNSAWSLLGNVGTNSTKNFLGTTDNQALVFKSNNIEGLRISPNGTSNNIGINTSSPRSSFDINTKDAIIVPVGNNTTDKPSPLVSVRGMLRYNTQGDKLEYYNNSSWLDILAGGTPWALSGNTGTNSATDFFGTIDNQDIVFKTYGLEAFRVTSNGSILPGNVDLKATLKMNGQPMLSDVGSPLKNNILVGNTQPANLKGTNNIYIGQDAGATTTTSKDNIFIGHNSGINATSTSLSNTFVGDNTGKATSSAGNSYFGSSAGSASTSAGFNSFFGLASGSGTTIGGGNTFFGVASGQVNVTGNYNTAIGYNAGPGPGTNFSNTTAIGDGALVSQDNSMVLGKKGSSGSLPAVKVGINTATPRAVLDIDTKDAIILPKGTSGDRNTFTPYTGMIRFNTTLNRLEYVDATDWYPIPVVVNGSVAATTKSLTAAGTGASSYQDYVVDMTPAPATGVATANPDVDLNPGIVISFVRVTTFFGVTIVKIRVQNVTPGPVAIAPANFNWNVTITQ